MFRLHYSGKCGNSPVLDSVLETFEVYVHRRLINIRQSNAVPILGKNKLTKPSSIVPKTVSFVCMSDEDRYDRLQFMY